MRLSFILLAAASVVIANCNAVSAVEHTKVSKMAFGDLMDTVQTIGTTRFLRGNQNADDSDDLDEYGEDDENDEDDEDDENEEEERGGGPVGAVEKVAQAVTKSKSLPVAGETAEAIAAKAAAAKLYRKSDPGAMRKAVAEMENGKKLATSTVLTSLVGRGKQRYSKDGRRLLSCIVVSHPEKGVGKDVLLISSSGKEGKWILPKGGWESHETITASALREVGEEAGVAGTITSSLGKMNFQNKKDKPYRYYGFELQATKIFDDWAESTRSRKWVTYKEAKGLLKDEPQMVKMVARAELSNLLRKRIAAGNQ